MSLIVIGIGTGGTRHSERELEKHEQRDRREDDVGGQGCRENVGCSGEGAERDKDWRKSSVRGLKSKK